ncbi:MAG: hypothetical protein PHE47_07045 [Oscillospiraceae bacterium]|nr:hypothetical protein [Oscillospiraceae bacterium]
MNDRFLKQTDDLLLAGVFWESADTRIFPALLSGLACSMLQVVAFFAPPGPNPDEACFFVPENQMELLLRFCRRLRQQTGAPVRVQITGRTLLEGGGWDIGIVQKIFLDDADSRRLLYLGKNAFVACCDSWDTKAILESLQAGLPESV